MFRTGALGLGVAVWFLCGLVPAQAASISYEFSGTLAQAVQRLEPVFRYVHLRDRPSLEYGRLAVSQLELLHGGSDQPSEPVVSLSFNVGNTSSSSLGAVDSTQVIVAHNAAADAFYVQEHFQGSSSGQGLYANLGMINADTVARRAVQLHEPPGEPRPFQLQHGCAPARPHEGRRHRQSWERSRRWCRSSTASP